VGYLAAVAFLDETLAIGGIAAGEARFGKSAAEKCGAVGEGAFPVTDEQEGLIESGFKSEDRKAGGEEMGGKAEEQPGEGQLNDGPPNNVQDGDPEVGNVKQRD
jgi:hypothetical protein